MPKGEALFDVIAVNLKTSARRIIAEAKTGASRRASVMDRDRSIRRLPNLSVC